jgi:hypothetical protein
MGLAVAAARSGGAQRLAAVRRWWRLQHPPPSVRQRLDVAYTTAITAAIVGMLAYGTAISALAEVVTPDRLAMLGPALLLLALVLAMRWGAYHGPVVFTVADVAFLLGAPLPRRGLAARRLVLALAGGAAAGAAVAGMAILGLAGEGRGIAEYRAAGLVAGLAELGVLAVAGAWAVQRSSRWDRAAWRARWPAALAAAGVAAVSDTGALGRTFALWSGPWGWAVQPGTGAGGAWRAALLLLTLVTAVTAVLAVRGCGACSAERHLRRAEGRASAVASLATLDARTARRTLERVGARDAGRPLVQLRRVRSARLAVAWRDVVAALRAPARVVEAAALAGGGTVLALLAADRPAALAAAAFAVYLGASRMLWPLRAELDVPERARILLRPRLGRILLEHALIPVVVTTTVAALAVAGCAVAGTPPAAVALLAVAVTPVLTLCAAMSARREGRLPTSVLATAVAVDPSGGAAAVVAWLTFWPALATTLGAVPLIAVTNAGPAVVAMAALWTAIATLALARLVQSPRHSG